MAAAETTGAEPSVAEMAARIARRSGAGGRREALARTFRLLVRTWRGRIGLAGLVVFVLMAILGPTLAPQDPNAATSFTADILVAPSSHHLLGTDENGRDVLAELLYAARISLAVGLAAAFISSVIGTAVGILSGFVGGIVDKLLTALDDWFLVIPFVPMTLVVGTLLGQRAAGWPLGLSAVQILVIGVLGWAGTARIVRAEVLTQKERAFVERSRALGAGGGYIMRRHILPNVMPLAFANSVLFVSLSVLTAATLSFLGLGDPTRFSWGQMLNAAYENGAMASGNWWYFIPPGLCITGLVLTFSLIGYALEEIVNPRLRERRG